MYNDENIIDVTPIAHSSDGWPRQRGDGASGSGASGSGASYGASASSPRSETPFVGGATTAKKPWTPVSALGGLVQTAVGVALITIGIPMLILPGPGLLSIGAGALLLANGMRKINPF